MSEPIDYATASADDTALTIEQMLHNRENWSYAAALIHHGQIPENEHPALAKAFPEFWLKYIAGETPGGKHAAH